MGRRDHLMRIALSANQCQIQEPVTPTESDDGEDDDLAATSKNENIQRLDLAQEAILSAIGFVSDAERFKKSAESNNKDLLSVATLCGLVNYHLPLPLSCQRNQILTFRYYDNYSYLTLLKRSWSIAGWSLLSIGMPSLLVYQLGYSVSMHYLQPRIVHKFRKSYPPASGKSVSAICMRLGVSLTVNLATWFILYPFWHHATLQSLLWLPYWEFFPPKESFYPRHNWNTFFLSYFYHFGIWLLQINVHKNFKQIFYPPIENAVTDHEGTYPSSLTGVVSDTIPMVLGLGVDTILLRSLAREFGPTGLVMNALEIGNVGLMVKSLAAEWAVEWAWLEAQYWANEWWYWMKGYHE